VFPRYFPIPRTISSIVDLKKVAGFYREETDGAVVNILDATKYDFI